MTFSAEQHRLEVRRLVRFYRMMCVESGCSGGALLDYPHYQQMRVEVGAREARRRVVAIVSRSAA